MTLYASENLLLFSMQRRKYSFQYELFFVVADTLSTPRPRIRRLGTWSRSVAHGMHLGGVYDVEFTPSGMISSFALRGSNQLEQSFLADLQALREEQFAYVGTPHLPATILSMGEADRIFHDRESFPLSIARYALLYIAALLAVLVPFILYAVIIFTSASGVAAGTSLLGQMFSVPLITIGALPFILLFIVCLEYGFQRLFLSWNFTAGFIIRRRCVHTGGYRPVLSTMLPSGRTFRSGAIICIAVLLISIILTLIL